MELISGLSSTLALSILDKTKPTQISVLETSAVHERAIDSFLEGIGDINTVEDLLDNYDVYSFVMKAFDLEAEIYGKGLIKKLLSGDSEDDGALVNILIDSRFEDLYEAMGFTERGTVTSNTSLYAWQLEMVDRYIDRQYVDIQAGQNETVGTILEFQRKVDDVENWFEVLADKDLSILLRLALNIPEETAQLDIDRQAEIFEEKMDIEDLKDPEILENLITRYAIISDALDTANSFSQNTAIQLMNSAAAFSSSGSSFTLVTIDISTVNFSASSIYR